MLLSRQVNSELDFKKCEYRTLEGRESPPSGIRAALATRHINWSRFSLGIRSVNQYLLALRTGISGNRNRN